MSPFGWEYRRIAVAALIVPKQQTQQAHKRKEKETKYENNQEKKNKI